MIRFNPGRKGNSLLPVISWASSEVQQTTYSSRDSLVVTHSYVDYFYAPTYSKAQTNHLGIYELVTLLSDLLFQPWLRQTRPLPMKIFSKVCTFNKYDQQHYIEQDDSPCISRLRNRKIKQASAEDLGYMIDPGLKNLDKILSHRARGTDY